MTPDKPFRMPEADVLARYDDLMFTGRQTVEKHIRWVAEQFVKDLKGGFGSWESWGGPPQVSRIRKVTFRALGRDVEVELWAPEGCHGFALQMCLEDQLRQAMA